MTYKNVLLISFMNVRLSLPSASLAIIKFLSFIMSCLKVVSFYCLTSSTRIL